MNNFKPFSCEMFWLRSIADSKDEALEMRTAGVWERFLLKAGNNDKYIPRFLKVLFQAWGWGGG